MSTRLLHLDSSILGGHSVSRSLSAAVVAQLQQTQPDVQVTYRDLAATPVPHLSGAYLAAAQQPDAPLDAALQDDLALGTRLIDEFLAADVIVVGLGFYNFGVPSQLKAWVDRITVAGKTFRYTATGVEGLAVGKRVVLAIARGGFYTGTPMQGFEHAETYLRGLFGFLGISDVRTVAAEGMNVGAEQRAASIAKAEQQIADGVAA